MNNLYLHGNDINEIIVIINEILNNISLNIH